MMGSSPLTRGIHPDAILCTNVQRFIPAHAGNTAASSLLLAATKVHPRSRGEYLACKLFSDCGVGSSPLTRGIRICLYAISLVYRFIPAHAGNTENGRRTCKKEKVHPRSRGEYTKKSLILSHFFQHPFSHFI